MRTDIEKTLLEKISDLPTLKGKVFSLANEGKKVVFPNGVFDLLHSGTLLNGKSLRLGDKLIIGLNSDNSVKR